MRNENEEEEKNEGAGNREKKMKLGMMLGWYIKKWIKKKMLSGFVTWRRKEKKAAKIKNKQSVKREKKTEMNETRQKQE